MKFYRKDAPAFASVVAYEAIDAAMALLKGKHFRDPEAALRAMGMPVYQTLAHFTFTDIYEAMDEAIKRKSGAVVLESVPFENEAAEKLATVPAAVSNVKAPKPEAAASGEEKPN